MNHDYADITSRIAEAPTWWDHNATPRYGAFTALAAPNVYAEKVALLLIACQSCEEHFEVEISGDILYPLGDPRQQHYGDPPHHNCVGDTMNCEDVRVLEVWQRNDAFDWVRQSDEEGPCTGPSANPTQAED